MCNKKQFDGKSAIITGGGQGLGEAIVRRLASEGANVVIADINLDACSKLAETVAAEYDVKAIPVKADVTNDDDVAAMVKACTDAFGKLDILVCNAGILKSGDVRDFATSDWRKVIDVNLVGYFVCAREASKVMEQQKSGTIIQINSKSGKRGSFKNSAYAASKFGGIGFTQSLALELAPFGVRVNSICPGNLLDSPLWVNSLYKQYAERWGITEEEVRKKYEAQVPLGRGTSYDDITNTVVFLASDQSSYMTGQAINVTGGQVMSP
ncbi:MAG: sorbitol-6-phosphate dehydrogenase [Armatimonadota bacterium]|nr:sorbitol-6-phosphate dehydrogenase [bacterium]